MIKLFREMRREMRRGILGGVIAGVILAGAAGISVEAQAPFSAQIQAALRVFLTQANTWTGTQTYTGVTLVPDGTAAAPSEAYASQPALGTWRVSAGIIGFTDALGSTGGEWITSSGFAITSTRCWNWGAGSDPAAIDTQACRAAAGIVSATSGFRAAFYTSPASSVLTITSNVISPTTSVHHLGAGLVKTITVPAACANTCSIDIVPDAAFTTDITGNISLASTATISRVMRFSWDGTKWNPSY